MSTTEPAMMALAAFAAPVIADRPTPTVTWHTFDLKSGIRGPQLTTQQLGTFGRIIGEATDCTLDVRLYDPTLDVGLPYPTTRGQIPGAESGTLPGRSLLVALNEDEQPIWGGMVLRRTSTSGEWTNVSCSTLEHYLDRRYVGDLTFTNTNQASIAAGVIDDIAVDGIGFVMDAPASDVVRNRTYKDDDDKTALSVLQELMGVDGGPEFTIDLEWDDDSRTRLRYVFRCYDRLGAALETPIQFDLPGCVTDVTFIEDYTQDEGADDVMATSSGEGDARPESSHHVAQDLLDGGWVKYEHRFEPSTSITNIATLDAHAAEELALMEDGLVELSLVANLDAAPRFGSDWHLGDDLTAVLICPRFPAFMGPDGDLMPGYSGRVRCVGVEFDYDARTVTPKVVPVDA